MVKHVLLAVALGLTSGAVLVTAAPQAMAKQAKKAKKAKSKGKAKEQPAKKDEPAKGEGAAAATVEEEKVEERTSAAQFTWTRRPTAPTDMDERADQKRNEAIEKLIRIIPTIAEGEQKAELVFRLSELYWGKSKALSLGAMRDWDAALEEWHKAGGKGREPKLEDLPGAGDADVYKRKALELYDQILAKYPNYARKDEVLYNLGSSLYESGEKKNGVEMYWKLIKQYPDSRFSADAWLQLGEHFFNANNLTNAIKAYTKAAETKKPRIFSYALYKLAWCDYNLQEYANALKKFRDVIEYAKKQKDVAAGDDTGIVKRDRLQLMEEALSDMVRAYSHLDAIDEAFEYYSQELGRDKAYKYVRKLSRLYNAEGKHELEIKAYERLNNEFPYAPEAPENHTAIMNAFAQLNRSKDVRREVRRMIDLYSPNGVWAQKNASNKQVLENAFDTVEQELANLVSEKHKEAQETKLAETYRLARDIYAEYLDKFTDTVNSYEFRFLYGDILFDLKEFRKAAEQFDVVVGLRKDGKYVKHSAYQAVLAWEKVASGVVEEVKDKDKIDDRKKVETGGLKQLEKIVELKKGGKYEPMALTEVEQKLADACDRFVEVAPDDEEVVKVKFKSAKIYYDRNHFEDAANRFGEIIDRWPKDKLAGVSAAQIMQSFNVREDWAQLNQWGRKFREKKLLMANADFAKEVNRLVEGASFNEIHFIYEPKAEPLEIADRYAAFVKEFPKSKYAMVGLYNTIVNYDKSNFLEKAIAYADTTLKEYKDFKPADDGEKQEEGAAALPTAESIRDKVLFLMASFHERLAEFESAAAYYEQYSTEFKAGERRADSLFNAGLLREGLGEFDSAIKSFEAYVKEYPKEKDAVNVAWRIGLILEKKKDYKASQAYFGDFSRGVGKADPARQICADYKVVQALAKQNKDKEVRAGYEAIIKSFQKLTKEEKVRPCPLEAVAAAGFAMLEPKYQEYMAISLTGAEKDLGPKLLRKLEMVDQLQKAYTEVLGIGQGDYGIASLYRIGAMYQHLAQAIFATPCPKRLDEDQCMIYQSELQAKAFPLEEKAIEAFDNALKKAYELGLYNDWLAKGQEALKSYEPARFPEIHEYELIAGEKVFELPELVEAQR